MCPGRVMFNQCEINVQIESEEGCTQFMIHDTYMMIHVHVRPLECMLKKLVIFLCIRVTKLYSRYLCIYLPRPVHL